MYSIPLRNLHLLWIVLFLGVPILIINHHENLHSSYWKILLLFSRYFPDIFSFFCSRQKFPLKKNERKVHINIFYLFFPLSFEFGYLLSMFHSCKVEESYDTVVNTAKVLHSNCDSLLSSRIPEDLAPISPQKKIDTLLPCLPLVIPRLTMDEAPEMLSSLHFCTREDFSTIADEIRRVAVLYGCNFSISKSNYSILLMRFGAKTDFSCKFVIYKRDGTHIVEAVRLGGDGFTLVQIFRDLECKLDINRYADPMALLMASEISCC